MWTGMNTLNGCRRSTVVKWKCFAIVQTSVTFLVLKQQSALAASSVRVQIPDTAVCWGRFKAITLFQVCVASLVHLGVQSVC